MNELSCLVDDSYCLVSRERVGIEQVDINDLHQGDARHAVGSALRVASTSAELFNFLRNFAWLLTTHALDTPDQGSSESVEKCSVLS